MAKDSLARGERSAMFMGGTPKQDDEIVLAPGMAATTCEHGQNLEVACVLCQAELKQLTEVAAKPEPKSIEELALLGNATNDRVLLRPLTEEDTKSVKIADTFVLESDIGIVICVGDGMNVGGHWRPIPYALGDKVRYGHYNAEDIDLAGEKLKLVSAYDIRFKYNA